MEMESTVAQSWSSNYNAGRAKVQGGVVKSLVYLAEHGLRRRSAGSMASWAAE